MNGLVVFLILFSFSSLDELKVCYVGKNTRELHKDHW